MQARPKIVKILVVALLVSLILAACGGGSTGKTWFNLPSIAVRIQPDGAMRVWGFNVGPFPQPALITQLQTANVQQLEVRIGYSGIHIYTNGEALPYVKWDEAAVQTVQDVLPLLPNVPNPTTIASALPWLRTIGLGVILDIPLASGQSALDLPRWRGENTITADAAAEPTLGPITIGSLAFDLQGSAVIEGVPAATLEEALGGMALPTLDANTLALLQGLGAESVTVKVHGNGIDLLLNDRPLPGVAWDQPRLNTLLTYVPALVSDPALVETLTEVVPLLNGADVTIAVSFTGEQAVDTVLTPIELSVSETGDLSFLGIPLAPGIVPADALANLQAANVQQLAVSINETGIAVAANGQTLPTVTWTAESLPVLAEVIGPMAGGTDLINTVLPVALGLGPNLRVNIPPAAGADAVEIPAEATTIQLVEAVAGAPAINLNMAVDAAGNFVQLGGFTREEFAQLGLTLPTIPVDSLAALRAAGIAQIELDTEPGVLNVRLGGNDALAINYDQASIMTTLDIATPFLGESTLTNPIINQLLREQIIPLVLTSDADVVIDLP